LWGRGAYQCPNLSPSVRNVQRRGGMVPDSELERIYLVQRARLVAGLVAAVASASCFSFQAHPHALPVHSCLRPVHAVHGRFGGKLLLGLQVSYVLTILATRYLKRVAKFGPLTCTRSFLSQEQGQWSEVAHIASTLLLVGASAFLNPSLQVHTSGKEYTGLVYPCTERLELALRPCDNRPRRPLHRCVCTGSTMVARSDPLPRSHRWAPSLL